MSCESFRLSWEQMEKRMQDSITPALGYYALFLARKGVDPISGRGLEALSGFYEQLMLHPVTDALKAFNDLGITHSDLETVLDFGYSELVHKKPSLHPASGGDSNGKQ